MHTHCIEYVKSKGTPAQQKRLAKVSMSLGYMIEKDASARKVLLATYCKSRCLFGDILTMVDTDGNMKKTAYCIAHDRPCPIPGTDTAANEVMVSTTR